MNVAIGIIVFVIVVIAIRELFTWYTKATKIVEQNEKIIELLFTIAKHSERIDDNTFDVNKNQ